MVGSCQADLSKCADYRYTRDPGLQLARPPSAGRSLSTGRRSGGIAVIWASQNPLYATAFYGTVKRRMCGAPLEQDGKPFLCEMVIMGQDFGDALLPHRLHRNAIGQAVSLVRAGLVEGNPERNVWLDCG